MSAALLETLSGGVGQRLIDRLLSPALYFWIAGGLAYLRSIDNLSLSYFKNWSEPTTVLTGALLVALVAGSSIAVEYLYFPALRFLEGYWSVTGLNSLRRRLIERQEKKYLEAKRRWNELADRFEDLERHERDEYAGLDRRLLLFPEGKTQLMPTALGNIIRAAEVHGHKRYGLASSLIWPRLWLVMPIEAREEVAAARRRMDRRIGLLIWGLVFAVWTIFSSWALVISVVAVSISYRSTLAAAVTYSELYRSSFDLYHRVLLNQLGWKVEDEGPPTPRYLGDAATLFLRRGDRPKGESVGPSESS